MELVVSLEKNTTRLDRIFKKSLLNLGIIHS